TREGLRNTRKRDPSCGQRLLERRVMGRQLLGPFDEEFGVCSDQVFKRPCTAVRTLLGCPRTAQDCQDGLPAALRLRAHEIVERTPGPEGALPCEPRIDDSLLQAR